MKYPLTTLLAILQQAEYDLTLWQAWVDTPREANAMRTLTTLQPERWTLKLKIIRYVSKMFGIILSPKKAVPLAVFTLRAGESVVTQILITLASQKLQRLQARGLKVVAIAGSYGKTSVKHLTRHVLAHQWFTLMTPSSYNTPLGIALTILKQLTDQHEIFLVELGEYQVGDIAAFLRWIQPEYAILTPIGYAHGERFGNSTDIVKTFQPLIDSPFAPKVLLIDDQNRAHFPATKSNKIVWYGSDSGSEYQVKAISSTLEGSTEEITTPRLSKVSAEIRLLGHHQLNNALPAIALTTLFRGQSTTALQSLRYAPDVPRRLSLTKNLNGSIVIDNSYNTNPGAWQEIKIWIDQVKLPHLALITSGYVELDPQTNDQDHRDLARDLAERAQLVGVIASRYNQPLIDELQKRSVPLIIGSNLEKVLSSLAQQPVTIETLWLEGGMRELYQ